MPPHSDSAEVAQTTLVQPHTAEGLSGIAVDEQGSNSPSGSEIAALVVMAPEHVEFKDLKVSQECKEILRRARADSTNQTSQLKWKNFFLWCRSSRVHPGNSSAEQILPYLLHLGKMGLAHSSIRERLAAISRFRRSPNSVLLWSNSYQTLHEDSFSYLPTGAVATANSMWSFLN